ncbi:hypothetical protein NECID01_0091 [Nematocida sp. AWRm77]|nr:hypothetical protein NECID01_0091 [Nematocida sp. AWRm77]
MEYNKLKTRLKNKLIKEYRKTQHTEEYITAENTYKKTRESIKLIEVEMQSLMDAFSNNNIYENITTGLFSGFEKMRNTIKGTARQSKEATKELPDAFSTFAEGASAIAQSAHPSIAEKYRDLARALKVVSSARLQFRDDIAQNLNIIKEMKEKSRVIDDVRVEILDTRQLVETAKSSVEEDRLKERFAEECGRVYEQMQAFCSSKELEDIADGVSRTLRVFFGDAFDAISENGQLLEKKAAE